MTPRFPQKGTRPHLVLLELLIAPGTFWQVCERANIDLNHTVMASMRTSMDLLERGAFVRRERITYYLTDAARARLAGKPAPYVGQVAGPAQRGVAWRIALRCAMF